MTFHHTRHSQIRGQQRSISQAVIEMVLHNADIELPQARECRSLQLSHSAVAALLAEGHPLNLVEAARSSVLIVGCGGALVTIVKAAAGRGTRPAHARAWRRGR